MLTLLSTFTVILVYKYHRRFYIIVEVVSNNNMTGCRMAIQMCI